MIKRLLIYLTIIAILTPVAVKRYHLAMAIDAEQSRYPMMFPDSEVLISQTDKQGNLLSQGPAKELDGAVGWFNTDHPVRLADLRGKIVLLDFWTYCCVNCMHIIPDLKYLEEKYPDELVVIGIHSAKFDTEKEADNLRQAILRYGLTHPVANDSDYEIWSAYIPQGWPTQVLIDPEGQIIARAFGEQYLDQIDSLIERMIEIHTEKGTYLPGKIEFSPESDAIPDGFLSFPGGIHADGNGRLFISDSGHHRIIVTGTDGSIQTFIGSGIVGKSDGNFETASFNNPLGLVSRDEKLYVADAGNNLIRVIDLNEKTVETLSNRRGWFGTPETPELSTPWDVELADNILYIAMAGTHQIWQYNLRSGRFNWFAGKGWEGLYDQDLDSSKLAQTSGLSFQNDELFFVDSESSSVRRVLTHGNAWITTIVGAGLFEYGDVDGIGDDVRLQHPLGIDYSDFGLLVADTYNSKIKRVVPDTREVETIFENVSELTLDEPGAISSDNRFIYIADTNHGRIIKFDIETDSASVLNLSLNNDMAKGLPLALAYGSIVHLIINIDLPENLKINESAPFNVTVSSRNTDMIRVINGDLQMPSDRIDVLITPMSSGILDIDISVNYCEIENEGFCGLLLEKIVLPVDIRRSEDDTIEIVVSPDKDPYLL
ncbi:MAG TPA: thioredoxin-like domain-containing protein [bacterium]